MRSRVRTGASLKLTLLVLLLSVPLAAEALEVSATEWELGLRWIGNWEDELSDSSGNVLVSNFSFRLPLAFSDGSSFSFVPGLSLYTLRYRWDETAERTVLSDIEWRELTALVPLLETTVRWDFFSAGATRLALDGGLGFELPIPVKGWIDSDRSSKILSGYYGRAKFVMPSLSLLAYRPVTNAFDLSSRLGLYIPVHHLYDGESAPFYDHLMISLSVGIRLPSGERQVVEPPEPPEPEGAPPLPGDEPQEEATEPTADAAQ